MRLLRIISAIWPTVLSCAVHQRAILLTGFSYLFKSKINKLSNNVRRPKFIMKLFISNGFDVINISYYVNPSTNGFIIVVMEITILKYLPEVTLLKTSVRQMYRKLCKQGFYCFTMRRTYMLYSAKIYTRSRHYFFPLLASLRLLAF